MIRLELTAGEAETLREVCEDYLSDLRMEIGGTDKMEYREALKAKETLVKGLIERLLAIRV